MGAVGADKVIATLAIKIHHASRIGEHIAAVGVGQIGRNQRTAFHRRLNNNHGIGHASDNTIAARKVLTVGQCAAYTFRQDANSTVNGRFEIVGLAKVPTAIENAEVATSGKGIYTALGQYVGEKDAWSALPAGVYIVDGVKMVK